MGRDMIHKRWEPIFVLALLSGLSAARAAEAPLNLGDQVRTVFSAKCMQCHSARLARPKGKLGYLLDLDRVAANPKLVVKFDPAASELWKEIDDGDMPPDDAKAGPLTEPEKQLVHQWIKSGAPAPLLAIPISAPISEGDDSPERPLAARLLGLLGKLHMMVVHFPIALLAAAAIAESWWIWKRRFGMSNVVRFCVLLGAAGAVVAGILGWIHATYGGFINDSGQALMLHRWLGTAAGLAAIATALVCEWDVLRARRSMLFRGVLFASAALVGAAGHFGGMLVYGTDFFRL
jgi:uncharacterized membrane protein